MVVSGLDPNNSVIKRFRSWHHCKNLLYFLNSKEIYLVSIYVKCLHGSLQN